MTRHFTLLAGCAFMVMSGSVAYADCAEDLAMLEGGDGAGAEESIAKDGTLAPLQTEADAGAAQEETAGAAGDATDEEFEAASSGAEGEDEAIAKDGSLAPLEGEAGGAAVATSAQDAQAQQEGDDTAAEQAEGGAEDPARAEAIERAEMALAEGDEEGCMAALEEARGL